MSTTKHTPEPWVQGVSDDVSTYIFAQSPEVITTIATTYETRYAKAEANAARIVQCVNTCAKFPDPTAALTDLRLLIGQARGLLAGGDTDRADNMLIAALGVLDGEEA